MVIDVPFVADGTFPEVVSRVVVTDDPVVQDVHVPVDLEDSVVGNNKINGQREE